MDITAWLAAMSDNATGWGDEMRALLVAYNNALEGLRTDVNAAADAASDAADSASGAVSTANNAAPLAGSIRFSSDPAVRPGGTSTSFKVFFFTDTDPTAKQPGDVWVH